MVMELLRGQDLSNVLREKGALPVAVAVQYVLQATEALAEAHALGIVHRDLKQANLFLTSRADGSPCIKVLDFGISKVAVKSGSGSDMGMTRTQSLMGSPLYMSPEQMASARDVDQRTDIWAMGTVLYELLTGRVPFEAETMPQLCTLILHAEPPSLRSIRPEILETLERVVLRCLRKDRAQRYHNVAQLAADLAVFSPDAGPRSAERISRVLRSSGMSSTELLASSAPATRTAGASTGAPQAWGTTHASPSHRAVWLGLVAVVALSLAALVLWKATSAPQLPAPEASTAGASHKGTVEPETPSAPTSLPPAAQAAVPVAAAPALSTSSAAAPPSSLKQKKPAKAANAASSGKPKSGAETPVDPLSERN